MDQGTEVGVVGEAVRRLRIERGWAVRELAFRAGVAGSTVSRIERGLRPEFSYATVSKVAAALDCAVEDLTSGLIPPSTSDLGADFGVLRALVRQSMRLPRRAEPSAAEEQRLAEAAGRIRRLRAECLYAEVVAASRALLQQLRPGELEGAPAGVLRPLVHIYFDLATSCRVQGDLAAAWIAAQQCARAAAALGEQEARAAAAFAQAYIATGLELHHEAFEIVTEGLTDNTHAPVSLSGMLHLMGAMAATRSRARGWEQHQRQHLLEARRRAGSAPQEDRYRLNFDHANVVQWTSHLSLENGDIASARQALSRMNTHRFDTPNRHAAYLVDRARVAEAGRDYAGGWTALLQAHRVAPQYLRAHRAAQALAVRLLHSDPPPHIARQLLALLRRDPA